MTLLVFITHLTPYGVCVIGLVEIMALESNCEVNKENKQMVISVNKVTDNVDQQEKHLLTDALWDAQIKYSQLIKSYSDENKRRDLMDGAYTRWEQRLEQYKNMAKMLGGNVI